MMINHLRRRSGFLRILVNKLATSCDGQRHSHMRLPIARRACNFCDSFIECQVSMLQQYWNDRLMIYGSECVLHRTSSPLSDSAAGVLRSAVHGCSCKKQAFHSPWWDHARGCVNIILGARYHSIVFCRAVDDSFVQAMVESCSLLQIPVQKERLTETASKSLEKSITIVK